ncbi:Protein of unknown function [Spirosomataceae bacterium TFI 002]|nr:Protein of unknown function [Spirosomataceae bacterium TFI 002]
MKKLLTLVAALLTFSVTAQNLNTPAPSPTQTIKQDFALSNIEIKYSRPAMKGRAIFGDLVPFDKVWRTGANSPTAVTFGEDVTVGGVAVKAGTYNMVTMPGRSSWTVKLLKTDMNAFNYKEGSDVASFSVDVQQLPMSIENFTILFDSQTDNTVDIGMMWDNVYVAIPVKADVDAKVMGQIENVMNKDNKPYFAAASYYFENGKDNAKALEWAKKAVDAQPEAYWVRHLLAKVQAKSGMKKDAIATAKASMELAQKAGNMDYVRLNEKLLKTL